MLAKENFKTHNRHSSMGSIDFKTDTKLKTTNLSNFSNNLNNTVTKNINSMKEILFNNLPLRDNKISSSSKKSYQRNHAGSTGSNIVLNQGGNPCFNHITIYATNNSSSQGTKTNLANESNLRQYIINKVTNKPKSLNKLNGKPDCM
jgi:hypothetical protein